MIRRLATSLLLLAFSSGCRASPAAPSSGGTPASAADAELAAAGLGDGWIAWESNRTGADRIWIRPLAGGPPRRLSPDEPGRDHCCAHLSPDGERLVYLSLPANRGKYALPSQVGELHLVRTSGEPRDRVLARARHYAGGHRAALWWDEDRLEYFSDDGGTRLLDLTRGTSRVLALDDPQDGGWLVSPNGAAATTGSPSFAERDPASGALRRVTPLGGCEPYFTADGAFGIWTAGAGGPLDAIRLADRHTSTLVRRNDPRLPSGRGYLYFPMISRDRSLLALAASPGEHDHFRADYDIFVLELDAETLAPLGRAVRVTADPGVDRYPDVWRAAGRPQAPLAPPAARAASEAVAPDEPVFLWDDAASLNRRSENAESELLTEHGAVWADRRGRMALAGGWFAVEAGSAARVDAALRATNEFSLALFVQPATPLADRNGTILMLADRRGRPALVLRQQGDRLGLLLRTNGAKSPSPILLAPFGDDGPHHVAVRFSPGRLGLRVDGGPEKQLVLPGDFSQWRNQQLSFGAGPGGDAPFHGYLSRIRIWDRELSSDALEKDASAARRSLPAAPIVPLLEVRARLLARSRIPRLDEISPYRRALVVEEYSVLSGGGPSGEILRVARWALLDGEPTRAMSNPVGADLPLRLEPYAAQPQLESAVLSDTLPPAPDLPLQFAVGLDDG